MNFEQKYAQIINEFLQQFPQEKRNNVMNYLIVLGFDIARKLGQKNVKELYSTIKQLSKYIVYDYTNQGQSELREEIKKIQQQLVSLNSILNEQSQENFRKETKHIHNRFYTQNDVEEQQNYIKQFSQDNSKNHQTKTTKRNTKTRSPLQQSQNNLTAKITESPPPPISLIKSAQKTCYIKPHLDDHQIKQLLYHENSRMYQDDFDSISNRGKHNSSPKQLKYTLNFTNSNDSNRDTAGQRFQTHETNKKGLKSQASNSSRQKKKVPAYLQNVESKIKQKLDLDKQAFKAQKNYDDDEIDYRNYRLSKKQDTANFENQITPTQESNTYYDIQQYLLNQQNQNYHLSPVQEMKPENEMASNKKSTINFKEKTQNSQNTITKNNTASQNFFEQTDNLPFSVNPIQVSDFQMSKQQSDLSFDAFRKKTQFTSPYAVSLQQSSYPIQLSNMQKNDEESSESFSNFTPPNKEVREFFQKQCIF